MGNGSSQLFGGDLLVGHGLHHIGPGDKHVGAVLHHEDEVRDGGGVHRPAGTRTHDQRNLRDHSGGQHIALEDFRVATQGGHAFLDPGAARIVDADEWRPDFHGLVHNLADFFRMGLGQRAAKHREVLAEDENQPAVDGAVAGDHAITRDLLVLHAEVGAAVFDEHVPLLETAVVEEDSKTLTGGQLALAVLGIDALLATAQKCGGALLLQLLEYVLHA